MFKERSYKKELLDGENIPNEDLFQNLRELDRINDLLGGYRITFHALKKVLTPDALVSFETGVRYQMYHALFLLFVATTSLVDDAQKKQIFSMTRFGVLFFSCHSFQRIFACKSLSFSGSFATLSCISFKASSIDLSHVSITSESPGVFDQNFLIDALISDQDWSSPLIMYMLFTPLLGSSLLVG
jgi:uncharacterized membrane protein YgdD (TMEM256/DUF423 family)